MAYSMDFRQKVMDACDGGAGTQEVAERFGVSASWVRRLKQWRRERGSIAARPCGGSRAKLQSSDETAIAAHFAAHADTTIEQLAAALGTKVSVITVWRTARRLGYRFKKSQSMPRSVIGRTSLRAVKAGVSKRRPSMRKD